MNHRRVQQKPEGESLTKQSHGDAQDINRMVERHLKGPNRMGQIGSVPHTPRQPRFMDLSSAASYHDMLNRVSEIDTRFASLPSKVRGRFRNNPELLLRFIEDPANAKEAVKLGLISDPDIIAEVREAEQLDLEEQARKAGETAKQPSPDPGSGDPAGAARRPPEGD